MVITVLTSCSKQGWLQYGLKFVDTFSRFWPKDIRLHIVSEDKLEVPTSIMQMRSVHVWDLAKSSTKAREFYVRHHGNVRARGGDLKSHSGAKAYSFRHDAYKFSKKVFAIELIAGELAKTNLAERLIWLDADIYTYAPVTNELLARLPPQGYALACLDRNNYHSECGFIGYDLTHPMAHAFITAFADLYAKDEVFTLKEWHDSWVFDWLRKKMSVPSYHIPHKSTSHPFVYSELGLYMDHLKGARKQHGISHDHPRYRKDPRQFRKVTRGEGSDTITQLPGVTLDKK